MPKKPVKRKRKKIKYKKLSLALSVQQHRQLAQYCSKYKLTPVRVIKKAIKTYLERFGPVIDQPRTIITHNQLTIFDAGAGHRDEFTASEKTIRR